MVMEELSVDKATQETQRQMIKKRKTAARTRERKHVSLGDLFQLN